MDIREAIEKYRPCCEQEARDKAVMLSFIDSNSNAFERSNLIAHMTASAWVVNPARDKVLMVYHKIYDSWSWTAGTPTVSVTCCPSRCARCVRRRA